MWLTNKKEATSNVNKKLINSVFMPCPLATFLQSLLLGPHTYHTTTHQEKWKIKNWVKIDSRWLFIAWVINKFVNWKRKKKVFLCRKNHNLTRYRDISWLCVDWASELMSFHMWFALARQLSGCAQKQMILPLSKLYDVDQHMWSSSRTCNFSGHLTTPTR